MGMSAPRSAALVVAALTGLAALWTGGVSASGASPRPAPVNVDVSQRHTNESEEAVAVNPLDPRNVVIVTNVDFPAAGRMGAGRFDGRDTLGAPLGWANPKRGPRGYRH